MDLTPYRMFLTRGVGRHHEKLSSFELALRDAGIQCYNLVTVSSILPAGVEIVKKEVGLDAMKPGQIVFCVMARNSTDEPGRQLAASVGVAVPGSKAQYGYLSEHHSFGQNEREAGEYAEDLAAEMLASTLGIDFDPDGSWDEKKEQWKIGGKVFRTRNITQAAVCRKRGGKRVWTTVVTAAVFII